jgi:stress response protein SCP2
MPGRANGNHGDCASVDAQVDQQEVVVGLRWDPPDDGKAASDPPVDLDVACVSFDEQSNIVDIVHPGHTRNANDSIVHTGDSTTGVGAWDDERIFVFPAAVPDTVSALTFVVVSVAGRGFNEIPRAICHVSDGARERELLQVVLNDLGPQTLHSVATLCRSLGGWRICPGVRNEDGQSRIVRELLPLIAAAKTRS